MHAGTPFETTYSHVKRMERIALEYKDRTNVEFGRQVVRNVFATAGGHPMGNTWGRNNAGVNVNNPANMMSTEWSNFSSMHPEFTPLFHKFEK